MSIYPLPLDRLRMWITSKTNQSNKPRGQLPCTSLKITDVWTLNLPYIRTESPVRTTDINKDGIDDLVFGFRTGALKFLVEILVMRIFRRKRKYFPP